MPETTGRCIHQDFWGDPQSRCPKDALDGLLGKCLDHASVAGLMGLAVREMGENRQLRAMVRGLAKAIEGLMEGIDDYWRTTPEGTGAVFHARSILESVPSDLRAPAKASREEEAR